MTRIDTGAAAYHYLESDLYLNSLLYFQASLILDSCFPKIHVTARPKISPTKHIRNQNQTIRFYSHRTNDIKQKKTNALRLMTSVSSLMASPVLPQQSKGMMQIASPAAPPFLSSFAVVARVQIPVANIFPCVPTTMQFEMRMYTLDTSLKSGLRFTMRTWFQRCCRSEQ